MTKDQLTSYVRTAILKHEAVADNQKTLHFQRVAQAVVYAFDTLLSQIRFDEKGLSEIESYFVKHYYNQSVKESTSGYRYVGVSDSIVPIGDKGIWYVQPSGGGNPFSKISRPKLASYRNLYVGGAINETFWRIGNLNVNTQIILESIGDSPYKDIRTVDYGIVRSLHSYASTEDVRVPSGRIELLVQLCMAQLSTVYDDKINNNQ